MLGYLLILIFAYYLAKLYERCCSFNNEYTSKKCGWVPYDINGKIFFCVLALMLILYSGLRTKYNDTGNYIAYYLQYVGDELSEIRNVDISVENAFGFEIYEIIIKFFLGNNYARFLTVTALITIQSNICFFKKYSRDFSMSIFLMVASTYYTFTMAAVRQSLAMAIALWAIPMFANKKMIRGIVMILIAASIHQFVLVYVAAIFLVDNVMNKKTFLIIVLSVVGAISFGTIMSMATNILGYESENIGDLGTNILRVLVWIVPIAMAFIGKKSINLYCNQMSKMIINLAVVGGLLMFIASFGAANLIGRLAFFMYPFFIMAFSEIIPYVVNNRRGYSILRLFCMIGFFGYYSMLTLRGVNLFEDPMMHNSFWVLFRSTV